MGRVVQPATCPACDGEFLPNRTNRLLVTNQVYCGNQCSAGRHWIRQGLARRPKSHRRWSMGASHYMPALRSERICDYWACMVLFIPARSDQRFHSRRCKDLDRAPMIFERPCGACSRLFRPKRNAYAVFCSKGCNQRARRASLNGPRSVLKTGVADRDGWICRIPGCGLPVERGMRFPDPWSPSVDHVIPVSFGGGNDPENLRLAHLVCNMRRGVRPL